MIDRLIAYICKEYTDEELVRVAVRISEEQTRREEAKGDIPLLPDELALAKLDKVAAIVQYRLRVGCFIRTAKARVDRALGEKP